MLPLDGSVPRQPAWAKDMQVAICRLKMIAFAESSALVATVRHGGHEALKNLIMLLDSVPT
jgi:hypothetical protein